MDNSSQNNKPKVIVFASGSKTAGGSGFEVLVNSSRNDADNPSASSGQARIDAEEYPWASPINYEVVAVVSNHENGGVRQRADKLGVPFIHLDKDHRTAEDYERVVQESGAEWVALSGWLKLVPMKESPDDPNPGLDPRYTINIHPGPLPQFGGAGMYGHFVHEAVMEAHRDRGLTYSAVSMHFATKVYDEGPKFLHYPVPIKPNDTPETLGKRVNEAEHKIQPLITNLVVNGEISWNGKDPKSLKVPEGYEFL
jgi:phosphoribosylglycinamide formyltransferase 1